MFIRIKIMVYKELPVFCILEEYPLDFLECKSVERQCNLLCKSGVFDGCAEAGDVCHLRHVHQPASDSAINVRLDRVTEHDVRLHLFQKLDVVPDQCAIGNRVRAVAGNLDFVIDCAQFDQVIDSFTVGAADMHFVAVRNQAFHQFKAEVVNHHIVIDKEEDGILLHYSISMVF